MIRVNPTLRWPFLEDGDVDIDAFFIEFKSMTGLANDGQGMRAHEKLLTLGLCLRGSKHQIYEQILKVARRSGKEISSPQVVYEEVVDRMNEFRESTIEQQRRSQRLFEELVKGNRTTALQFRATFEAACDQLEVVGLAKNDRELLLSYLSKVGNRARVEIMKDRRDYGDKKGSRTWILGGRRTFFWWDWRSWRMKGGPFRWRPSLVKELRAEEGKEKEKEREREREATRFTQSPLRLRTQGLRLVFAFR